MPEVGVILYTSIWKINFFIKKKKRERIINKNLNEIINFNVIQHIFYEQHIGLKRFGLKSLKNKVLKLNGKFWLRGEIPQKNC